MITLIAAALLLQAKPPAAELLKKVEEKYAAAKSFSCTMDGTLTSQGGAQFSQESWKGEFKSKGDGLARAELSLPSDGKKTTLTTLVSDGKNMAIWTDKNPPQKRTVIAGIGPWTRNCHSRVGVAGFMRSAAVALFKAKTPKLDALYKLAAAADAGTEKVGGVECRIVSCVFDPPDRTHPQEKCRLWIDPENLVLLKREAVTKSGGATVTLTETFGSPVFDAEIADDDFKLP